MIIIKAGGSAITMKDKPYTLDETAMHHTAKQLVQIKEPVILIHGVGSYGHPPAKQYQIGLGYDGSRERVWGLMLTHYWVDELSQRFTRVLLDHELLALRCRPTTLFVTDQRRIVQFNKEPLDRFLKMNILPVLHGDGPSDRSQGFCVLSGDQIAVYLAKTYKARKVIFGMDVPGILKSGRPVGHVRYDELLSFSKYIKDNEDASGGLSKKLQEIAGLQGERIPVQLVSLHNPDDLLRAVNDQTAGTLID